VIAPGGSGVTELLCFLTIPPNREPILAIGAVEAMSERIEGTAFGAVGRSCGFTGLILGCLVNALGDKPILAFKAGGLLALVVTFSLLLLGSRAERTCFTKTRIWRELEGHERPSPDRAQAVIGAARRRAFLSYAYLFALAAAASLAVALAADLNLLLHPPR
jgi:hypothetical protein